jgi:ribosomal protein S18 acetylase RimI-like enzyme
MKIRKAELSDSKELVEKFISFKKEFDLVVTKFFQNKRSELKPFEEIEEYIQKNISDPNRLFLVAIEADKIIGFACGSVETDERPIFPNLLMGKLRTIWVSQEHRGKGVASQLRDKLFAFFKEKNVDYIEIITMCGNKNSNSMYKKWGFENHLNSYVKGVD